MRILERRPSHEAEIFAEAQTLLDDGFESDFVLELFPDDTAWLASMLGLSGGVKSAIQSEAPSYYFEASLKTRFLAAARERPAPVIERAGRVSVRTGFASAGVMAAIGALGIATFGFVTAENADPGDWNYGVKQTNERIQYALARGNDKVDVQLHQLDARVYEAQRQQAKGGLSASDLARLQDEARQLADLAKSTPFDETQLTRLQAISNTASRVLDEAKATKPDLGAAVATTRKSVDDAVSAGIGSTTTLAAPTPSATPLASPSPSAEPSATVSPSPATTAEPSPSATTSVSPAPSTTAAAPTETPSPTPAETATPAPSSTPAETATPAPSSTPQ